MFSIVIPLYNKENLIEYSIRSILSQTFQDFEIIVVNDGSTDNSVSMAESVMDSRIRIINQANAGVSAARNRGIKEAKYDLIAFLDADDEWKPDYLDTQNRLAQKYSECSVFACNYEFHNSNGQITPTIIRKLPFTSETGVLTNYFEVACASHPPLCTSAVAVRKQALEAVEGFPVGIKSGEDLLTWARLAVKFKIAYNRTPLAIYNLGEGYDYSNLPPRKQDIGDPVGKNLLSLYNNNPDISGFRKYISHWHRMRASTAIRFGDRKETIIESIKALKFNLLNYKVILFMILAILPYSVSKKIISNFSK